MPSGPELCPKPVDETHPHAQCTNTQTHTNTEQITLLEGPGALNTKQQSFFKTRNCFFDSPQCLAVHLVAGLQMWGGPKERVANSLTSPMLVSPVAASHVAIHTVGTIAGAAAREVVCVAGLIFFL